MNTTTRIHTAGESKPPEFHAGAEQQQPATGLGTVEVAIIGHTGQVGSALAERLNRLATGQDLPALRLAEGINRSSHRIVDSKEARDLRRDAGTLDGLERRLLTRGRQAVVVDCSADPDLPRRYPGWLRTGIGVVTPNKHGFSGELDLYRSIHGAAALGRAPLGYSATVGAGLPILSTLRRLRRAGAEPRGLSAVVSGTLAHVFSGMSAGLSLSAAVADARERGFTEPDPLEDLSGRDVARKLSIMLREMGLEEALIEREPVVPDAWARSIRKESDVISALVEHDAAWSRRMAGARAAGQTWAYLAQFGPQGARVGPMRLAKNSPFARLEGSGNLARIQLADDPQTPLEVFGPGAGVAVTAGSVLADLADAAAELVRRR